MEGRKKKPQTKNHSIATQNELYRSSPQREFSVFSAAESSHAAGWAIEVFPGTAEERGKAGRALRPPPLPAPLPVPAPELGLSPARLQSPRSSPKPCSGLSIPPSTLLKNNPVPCLPYAARLQGSSCCAIHLVCFK